MFPKRITGGCPLDTTSLAAWSRICNFVKEVETLAEKEGDGRQRMWRLGGFWGFQTGRGCLLLFPFPEQISVIDAWIRSLKCTLWFSASPSNMRENAAAAAAAAAALAEDELKIVEPILSTHPMAGREVSSQ